MRVVGRTRATERQTNWMEVVRYSGNRKGCAFHYAWRASRSRGWVTATQDIMQIAQSPSRGTLYCYRRSSGGLTPTSGHSREGDAGEHFKDSRCQLRICARATLFAHIGGQRLVFDPGGQQRNHPVENPQLKAGQGELAIEERLNSGGIRSCGSRFSFAAGRPYYENRNSYN